METRAEVRAKVSEILCRILDEEVLVLTDATTAEDIDGWDSINHVKLVIEIEKFYHIRFAPDEISAPENVGAFAELIRSYLLRT